MKKVRAINGMFKNGIIWERPNTFSPKELFGYPIDDNNDVIFKYNGVVAVQIINTIN